MSSRRIRRLIDSPEDHEAGFSLIEAVVATGLMAGALVSLGQMVAMSIASNRSARVGSDAVVLAQQKMEQLDTPALVDTPTGGTGLSASPAGTLTSNIDGWVDYVDQFGRSLGGGVAVRDGTVYVRRWSIEPLPSSPTNTMVIRVRVASRIALAKNGSASRLPDEARLVSLKTRKAP